MRRSTFLLLLSLLCVQFAARGASRPEGWDDRTHGRDAEPDYGRVFAAEGWRRPDRWVRDPVTGEYSYQGSTYTRLFAGAGFTVSEIPDAEHNSRGFVLRQSSAVPLAAPGASDRA